MDTSTQVTLVNFMSCTPPDNSEVILEGDICGFTGTDEGKSMWVNYGLSEVVCGNLTNYDTSQVAVQDLVSNFLMYRSIFETAIQYHHLCVFVYMSVPGGGHGEPQVLTTRRWCVVVLGSWSDRWGRRVPLMFALTCLLGESTAYLVNALVPSWPLEVTLVSSVPYSLSGGTHGLLMLCFAHLADNSKSREGNVNHMFVQRALKWDPSQYSQWATLSSLLSVLAEWTVNQTVMVVVVSLLVCCQVFPTAGWGDGRCLKDL
ncbi:putative proton-coupled folate transporter-like 9 [Homarus americanus]|uniref:Putative proton-coupled folate transporter-like 9 n=1 Tax=Homarus americanus TaxID=6706 RepID=A0A8J5JCZ7_HOMAM|nr:putative proton-coupled folate transporter-like 9 [Homarus americanus]